MVSATVVIQARMGSTRLPGKSMADLGGRPVIDWVVERAASAELVDSVIVATSTNSEDDVLAQHVEAHGVATAWRGDPDDVLDRFAGALSLTDADVIVRVTGDCPFVQPELIDLAIATQRDGVYSATDPDGRFPRGFDVEAVSRAALVAAAAEATDPDEREHVTVFVVRRPERFAPVPLVCPEWARRPDLRLTLDEPDDLALLRAVVDGLDATPSTLDGPSIIEFLDDHPDIAALNGSVHHNIVK